MKGTLKQASSFAAVVLLAAASVAALGPRAAAQEPRVSERMLPADTVVAVFLRDGNATAERWPGTALCEVLRTPEMKEMLAPLAASLRKAASLQGPLPTPLSALAPLLKGEVGVGAAVRFGAQGPAPFFQAVLRPADPQQARQVLETWIAAAEEMKLATREPAPEGTTMLRLKGKAFLAYSFVEGVALVTLCPRDSAAPVHQEMLSRSTNPQGGLARDEEYLAVRKRLGAEPEGWMYVGAFSWLARNQAALPMVAPILQSLGVAGVRGCVAGCTIEDRGFRTRLFIHITPEPGQAAAQARLITREDLALVPGDVVAFSMGPMDLPGLYDKVTGWLGMIPPPKGPKAAEAIRKVEQVIGMSIRQDLLPLFGDRYLYFAPEPSSPAGGRAALFLSIRDRKQAAEKATKLLATLARAIHDKVGQDGAAFVRTKTIERQRLTQVYPESVLPAAFTPNLTFTDGWLGVGLSARSTLARTNHLLAHEESVTARPDFAAQLAKVPQNYYAISYTDVGRCFGNGLSVVQFLADLGVLGLKVAHKQGELALPMDIHDLWPMDPGRFPDEALLRQTLFGSVGVWVKEPDGIRYENWSPVGPLPLPARRFGAFQQNQLATMSILAGMVMPALARARGQARSAVCRNNLQQIGMALVAYRADHKGRLPASLADLFPEYVAGAAQIFKCPSDRAPMRIKKGLRCSYRYIGNVPRGDARPDLIIAYDHRPHRRMRNALHLDGHVNGYTERMLRKRLAEQYARFKELIKGPQFPGDRERVKAFFENRDFRER